MVFSFQEKDKFTWGHVEYEVHVKHRDECKCKRQRKFRSGHTDLRIISVRRGLEARDIVKNPTVHTAPTTKNYDAQTVNSTEVEKSCPSSRTLMSATGKLSRSLPSNQCSKTGPPGKVPCPL